MPRILILGGYGQTGKALTRHLLRHTTVDILLGGRHPETAREFIEQVETGAANGRVAALRVDAGSEKDLRRALRETDLLLVAAPVAQYTEKVVRAVLDAQADYLDLQLNSRKLAILQSFAREITAAGRCFITEAGFHPGLPAALVRYAAGRFDNIETAMTAGYLNMGRALPYSEAVDELMEVFRNYQGQVYANGRWTKPGSFDIRKVDFGGDIGIRKCFSMFFEELRALPEMYPALKETGFYMSETHWFVDYVVTFVVLAGLKVAPNRGVRPLGKLMWWAMQTFPKPPYGVLLKVEATGERAGKLARFEATVSHPDGYELTAIPVVACLRQYLDGSVRRPGVWMMGRLVEPVRLFNDMERMGVRLSAAIS